MHFRTLTVRILQFARVEALWKLSREPVRRVGTEFVEWHSLTRNALTASFAILFFYNYTSRCVSYYKERKKNQILIVLCNSSSFLLFAFKNFIAFRRNEEILNVVFKKWVLVYSNYSLLIFFLNVTVLMLARSKHVAILVLYKVVFGGHLLISFSPF